MYVYVYVYVYVAEACRLLIKAKPQLLKLIIECRCIPSDGSQGSRKLLRHWLTLQVHHQLAIHHEALSFQPGLLRPLHIAHPEVGSSECHRCGAWLKDRVSIVITEAIAPLLTLHSDPELVLVFGGLTPQLCHALIVTLDLILIIITHKVSYTLCTPSTL